MQRPEMGPAVIVSLAILALLVGIPCAEASYIAINCGDLTDNYTTVTDGATFTWLTDRYYTGPTEAVLFPNLLVENMPEKILYQSARVGEAKYVFELANGNWSVGVYFAEPQYNSSGARVFTVTFNGNAVFPNLDIFQWSGGKLGFGLPLTTSDVVVSSGSLVIQLTAVTGLPLINAIRIWKGATSDNTTLPTPAATRGVNCGGAAVAAGGSIVPAGLAADSFFTDTGAAYQYVANSSDLLVSISEPYLSRHEGDDNFTYSFPLPNGDYEVDLYFMELSFKTPGMRIMDIYFNGILTIPALDVVAVAGGQYEPLVLKRSASVRNGLLSITFTGLPISATIPVTSRSFVSAITVTPFTTTSTLLGIDCGSLNTTDSALGFTFGKDEFFTGGTAATFQINASLSNAVDGWLYSTARVGEATYSIQVPNGNYVVDLRFAEPVYTAAGQRVFDVSVNGQKVVTNLDIFKRAHGAQLPISVQRSTNVTNGKLSISLTKVTSDPLISAIVLRPELSPIPARVYEAAYPWPRPSYPSNEFKAQEIYLTYDIPLQPYYAKGWAYAVNCGCSYCPDVLGGGFNATFKQDPTQCLSDPLNAIPYGEPYCRTNIKGPQGGYAVPLNRTIEQDGVLVPLVIANTTTQEIYFSERIGFNTYIFNTPPGIYEVSMFFAETSFDTPVVNVQAEGLRVFFAILNGNVYPHPAPGPIDPFKFAGDKKYVADPVVTTYSWVDNERLSIQLWPVGDRDAPSIKAVWVHQIPDAVALTNTDPDNPAMLYGTGQAAPVPTKTKSISVPSSPGSTSSPGSSSSSSSSATPPSPATRLGVQGLSAVLAVLISLVGAALAL